MLQHSWIKIRLKPTSSQAKDFEKITITYRDACNIVSQWYFDHHFKMSRKTFNNKLYHSLRTQFPELNSGMVQSTYRTVITNYKMVETQLKRRPLYVPTGTYNKKGKEIWSPVRRDLEWLWKPVFYKRPQADYVRGVNYSFVKKAKFISMNVLGKRIKVAFDHYYLQKLLSKNVKLGTAKLVHACGKWFFHIAITTNIPDELQYSDVRNVIGVDRGLRFIATTYDSHQHSKFISGKQILTKRNHFKHIRAQLQSKRTPSARQRLKKIGHRENRWMSDINHQISKTLVDFYGPSTLFVLEDLTGIKKVVKHRKKDKRYEQNSWAFYQLEADLTYKALQNHSKVIKVPAQYTSQRCPKCGRINKNNRNHELHVYTCDRCGYQSNDDRIGAMNIQELGLLMRNGINNPKFKQ